MDMEESIPIYVVGAGGHAKVIINILQLSGYNVIGIYDDYKTGSLYDIPILGSTDEIDDNVENIICAIGNNNLRREIIHKINSKRSFNWRNAIHPNAIIPADFIIGCGNVICPGVIIQPGVEIGNHCIINTSASVDHDCMIHDYVHIAPNATLCGNVFVGASTLIGAGSTTIPNVCIGENVIVGAGSVIICDIRGYVTVYGVPVKIQYPCLE